MIDNSNINTLGKNQVSAVFHSRAIRRSLSLKFIELCIPMETPVCALRKEKRGGRDLTKTSVVEFFN